MIEIQHLHARILEELDMSKEVEDEAEVCTEEVAEETAE